MDNDKLGEKGGGRDTQRGKKIKMEKQGEGGEIKRGGEKDIHSYKGTEL
jgi:hypothetical protein